MTDLRTHLTSLDGAPVIGWTLLALGVLWAVCAVWAAGGRAAGGSDYRQGVNR